MEILYRPEFDDLHDLTDHYYRALWALRPYLDRGWRIFMPSGCGVGRPGRLPGYFDPKLARLHERFAGQFEFSLDAAPSRVSLEMVWRNSGDPATIEAGANSFLVDESGFHPAAERYLRPAGLLANPGIHSQRLARWIEDHRTARALLVGTGPGLDECELSISSEDCVIVCNSIVRNSSLLDRLRPNAIAFSDPVFHLGPSRLAALFRRDLVDAARRTGAHLFVQIQDAEILKSHLPEDLHGKILALEPSRYAPLLPNLRSGTTVRETRNILTLFMFPLACAVADTIELAGFDGKAPTPEAGKYFWSHARSSQYTNELLVAELAHPAFFQIDYDRYYRDHCQLVYAQITTAEALGKRVRSLTPSFIPALARRTGSETPPPDESVPSPALAPIECFSRTLTLLRRHRRLAAAALGMLVTIAIALAMTQEGNAMILSLIVLMALLSLGAVAVSLIYAQWSARRLETRIRRDLTDQQVRVHRALYERIDALKGDNEESTEGKR